MAKELFRGRWKSEKHYLQHLEHKKGVHLKHVGKQKKASMERKALLAAAAFSALIVAAYATHDPPTITNGWTTNQVQAFADVKYDPTKATLYNIANKWEAKELLDKSNLRHVKGIWAFPQKTQSHRQDPITGRIIKHTRGEMTTIISRDTYHKQKMAFKKMRNNSPEWRVITDPWIVDGKTYSYHPPEKVLPGLGASDSS